MLQIRVQVKPTFERLGQVISDIDIVSVLKDEVNKFGMLTLKYSKQLTPVGETGFLRGRQTISLATLDNIQAIVSTGVEYAIYVHEGTRYMRGRPFMEKGLGLAKSSVEGNIVKRLDRTFTESFKRL